MEQFDYSIPLTIVVRRPASTLRAAADNERGPAKCMLREPTTVDAVLLTAVGKAILASYVKEASYLSTTEWQWPVMSI